MFSGPEWPAKNGTVVAGVVVVAAVPSGPSANAVVGPTLWKIPCEWP